MLESIALVSAKARLHNRMDAKEEKYLDSGLYIVTLNNTRPISVNANDPRIADQAIKVTNANCKFGKAQSLKAREKNYFGVFGEHNVNFTPIALTDARSLTFAFVKAGFVCGTLPNQ